VFSPKNPVRGRKRHAGVGGKAVFRVGKKRIAPARQRFPEVAPRDVDVEICGDADRFETEARSRGATRTGLRQKARAEGGCARSEGEGAAQKPAAADRAIHDIVKAAPRGPRVARFVEFIPGHVGVLVV